MNASLKTLAFFRQFQITPSKFFRSNARLEISRNMASSTVNNRQLQATQKGGPFAFASVPKPEPGPNEVCIRMKTIGLNPLDWKQLYLGEMVQAWPATFGIDGAGIVEAAGQDVTQFKAGDEVFSLFGHGARAAAFQDIATVPEHHVAKLPNNINFEEAASLPICYITAASSIYYGLNISLPYIPDVQPSGSRPDSILVLGGSSGVGAAAIQLLRNALPSSTILTTSSATHHPHLTSLGATKTLDRNSPTLVSDIRSATEGGKGVDVIIDAVASAATATNIFDTLRADGPREYSQVFTGDQVSVPEDVKRTVVFGRKIFELPGGKNSMTALVDLMNQGKYKLPIEVQKVGNGFESIEPGLEQLKNGVSGTKLVVTV